MLHAVADELHEVFSERGHRVDVALHADPAFGSGWSRSALTRDLVLDSVGAAASHVGLDFRPVNGIGRELRNLSRGVDRRYRVLRARRTGIGEIRVMCSTESALADDELPLYQEEPWVFAWIPTQDGLIAEILIAEITGYHEGQPGYLDLGTPIPLGGEHAPPSGFQPTEEPLEGFDGENVEAGTGIRDS